VFTSHPFAGLDRPLRLQEFETPRMSRQSAYEGCKVVGPMHRPPVPLWRYPWYSESTPGPECDRKY
jgi:hypothetical protein